MPLRQTNLKDDSVLQCFRYMFDKPESLLLLAFSQVLPIFVYSRENLEFHLTSGCKSIVFQQPIGVGWEIRLARALDPWRRPKDRGLWGRDWSLLQSYDVTHFLYLSYKTHTQTTELFSCNGHVRIFYAISTVLEILFAPFVIKLLNDSCALPCIVYSSEIKNDFCESQLLMTD